MTEVASTFRNANPMHQRVPAAVDASRHARDSHLRAPRHHVPDIVSQRERFSEEKEKRAYGLHVRGPQELKATS